ncbi:YbbR-like domain-containing protein [uncultured Eudoraea sp.]|uniref:CdaR family protein n=1 Tax=uncultured Eudoraea sp. TaxID=1035614 RepID=UPI0026220F1A|nr:YbbR-like domain-containing protein [uncultured Eudoraea sp.]
MEQKEVKRSNDKRKINIFLIFLLCSFLAWLVSRLSETYVDRTTFDLEYINVPDSLLLADNSLKNVDVRLRASGFQFLGFYYNRKKIEIDLSNMANDQSKFYVAQLDFKKQIESQLSSSITLLEVDRDTLFLDFYQVELKDVPISPNISLNPAQNYLVDGKLKLEPSLISISGPKKELDLVNSVSTSEVELNEISEDFSIVVDLVLPEDFQNIELSEKKVRISGKVFRFSEKLIEIPVEVINLPEGTQIKTYPNTIAVLCKARIDRLKDISPIDFKVVANFQEQRGENQNLQVILIEKPNDVYSVQLMKNEVEFILKRQ